MHLLDVFNQSDFAFKVYIYQYFSTGTWTHDHSIAAAMLYCLN